MINEWVLRLHFFSFIFCFSFQKIEIKNCPILRQSKGPNEHLSLALRYTRWRAKKNVEKFSVGATLWNISFRFTKIASLSCTFETWITSLSYRGFVKLNSIQYERIHICVLCICEMAISNISTLYTHIQCTHERTRKWSIVCLPSYIKNT